MALSMQEKQHVGKEVAPRYLRARKKEKGIMLQKFYATTGYSPPYTAYLLRRYAKRVILGAVTLVPTRPSPWPRERKHLYGLAVVEGFIWMYHLAGELCGKRLEAAMPKLLRAMARHGTVVPDPLSLLPFSRWGLPPWTGCSGQRRPREGTGGMLPEQNQGAC